MLYNCTNEFNNAGDDENGLKEANKEYQHAATLYNKNKTEITAAPQTKRNTC